MDISTTSSASKRKREEDDESKRLAKLEKRVRKKAKQSQEAPVKVTSAVAQPKDGAGQQVAVAVAAVNGSNATSPQEPSSSGKRTKKQRKTAAEMWSEPETVKAPTVTLETTTTLEEAQPSNETSEAEVSHTARPEVKARRERKKKAKEQSQAQGSSTATKRSVKKNEQRREKRDKWKVSSAIGGRFIDADPVFTPDEKHLILATEGALHVYATESSLLVHILPAGANGLISCYTLSPSQPTVIWMVTDRGRIVQWEFETGKVLGTWATDAQIHKIFAIATPEQANDTLYTIDRARGWSITAHKIGIDGDMSLTELATLLNNEVPLRALEVFDHGRTIVLLSLDGFLVGSRTTPKDTPFEDQKYSWRDIKTTEAPMCFAVRAHANVNPSKKSLINVAIGGVRGCIYVFQDVSNSARPSAVMDLHWHREAVGGLTWSLDGNYIISGGRETVLVIWQLDTGHKQYLPHLESVVENVVVSPTGASYAVRLADNSVMVLSTSELKPTSNIAGLQAIALRTTAAPVPKIATVSSLREIEGESKDSVVCAINPRNPNLLHVVVPANQSGAENVQQASAPYLQIYDMTNARSIQRQALTRNNATDTNLGPNGERITEPDVRMIQISANGRWLATVEQWSPAIAAMRDLTVTEDVRDELDQLYDTKLKFWAWHDRDQVWMMNSRIDSPHLQADRSMQMLDVVSDPSGSRFATIGNDSTIKLWTPKSKTTSGRTIKVEAEESTKQEDSGTWWSLDLVIALEGSHKEDPLETRLPTRAKLAFSSDGTVLAAYEHFGEHTENSMVHFVDTERGVVTASRSGMQHDADGIHQMAFLGQDLVCTGRDTTTVWDVMSFSLKAEIRHFAPDKSDETSGDKVALFVGDVMKEDKVQRRPPPHLAVDAANSTFAISVAQEKAKKSKHDTLLKYRASVQVYSAEDGYKSVFATELPRLALSLLPAAGVDGTTKARPQGSVNGYVLLDVAAEVRFISSDRQKKRGKFDLIASKTPTKSKQDAGTAIDTAQEMDIDEVDGEAADEQSIATLMIKNEDDRPVVRTQELANVFDHQSHALPSMKDMFSSVLKLFSGRTLEHPAVAGQELGRVQAVY